MKTLILSTQDVQKLVSEVGLNNLMDQLIEEIGEAFRNFDPAQIEIPARSGFCYEQPHAGLIEWMPLYRAHESVLMKIVGYHPSNPIHYRLPTILSTISLYDSTSGHLRALVDGTLLTAMRTGAASAVASRWLANPESRTLGLIGCGVQSMTQLHALSRHFDFRDVLIHDTNPVATETFASRADVIGCDGLEIHAQPVATILAESDIVSVATSVDVGMGPVFRLTETKPWVHFNAVGSDLPNKTELPLSLLKQAFICADHPEQARKEGECQQLSASEIDAGLVDIARSPDAYQDVQTRRSVFDSTGWALEDQVAMDMTLHYADKMGIGTSIEIEGTPDDPLNPYEYFKSQDIEPTHSVVSAIDVPACESGNR